MKALYRILIATGIIFVVLVVISATVLSIALTRPKSHNHKNRPTTNSSLANSYYGDDNDDQGDDSCGDDQGDDNDDQGDDDRRRTENDDYGGNDDDYGGDDDGGDDDDDYGGDDDDHYCNNSPSKTPSKTGTRKYSSSKTPSKTGTRIYSASPSRTGTRIYSSSPSRTPTKTKYLSASKTTTRSNSPSITGSISPTAIPTESMSVTSSSAPTDTPSQTFSDTPTISAVPTSTPSLTRSTTSSNTPSFTVNPTPSDTPSFTANPTVVPSVTPSATLIGGRIDTCETDFEWIRVPFTDGMDRVTGVSVSDDGSIYAVGLFSLSLSFDNVNVHTSSRGYAIYVAKFTTNGDYLWSRSLNTHSEFGSPPEVVSDNNGAYIVGSYKQNITIASSNFVDNGAFVASIDSNGNWLWAWEPIITYNAITFATDIDQTADDLYIVFGSRSRSVTIGPTTYTSTNSGIRVYVLKMTKAGSIVWSAGASTGQSDSRAIGISHHNGNVYVTGMFYHTAVFGSTTITTTTAADLFVASAGPAGWNWALSASNNGTEFIGNAIASDSTGVYLAGLFNAQATFGSTILTSNGKNDLFIAKTTFGGAWEWAVNYGFELNDYASSITLDADYLYLAGSYRPNILEEFYLARLDKLDGIINDIATGRPTDTGEVMGLAASNLIGGFFSVNLTVCNTTYTSTQQDSFLAKIKPF